MPCPNTHNCSLGNLRARMNKMSKSYIYIYIYICRLYFSFRFFAGIKVLNDFFEFWVSFLTFPQLFFRYLGKNRKTMGVLLLELQGYYTSINTVTQTQWVGNMTGQNNHSSDTLGVSHRGLSLLPAELLAVLILLNGEEWIVWFFRALFGRQSHPQALSRWCLDRPSASWFCLPGPGRYWIFKLNVDRLDSHL